MNYLIEIKQRSLIVIFCCIFTSTVCYIYKEILLFIVIKLNIINYYFIFTDVTEIFYIYIRLILFINIHFFFIYSSLHCLSFISPALSKNEYNFIIYLFKISLTFWFISLVFTFLCLIPFSWEFFFSFKKFDYYNPVNLHLESKLNEYLEFIIYSYYLSLIYFQSINLFFILILLKKFNIRIVKKFRKVFYYTFCFISTFLCSFYILSQLTSFFFFIFFYEMIILFSIIKLLIRQPIKTYKNTNSKNKIT